MSRSARDQQTLFGGSGDAAARPDAPLAERMRPRAPDEVIGQQALVGADTFLGRMLDGSVPPRSILLWGPPGSGKTTVARLLASRAGHEFVSISAVLSGVREVREVVADAERRRDLEGHGTILFVDEIHRFNKAQQDAFLPHVEAGTIVLVGATTENPSFEVVGPLLSRCRVLVVESLSADALAALVDRALADGDRGLGAHGLSIDDDARSVLSELADGDARAALGALEAAADLARASGATTIDTETVRRALQNRTLRYDRAGEEHYNVISAFIKTMRAGDADAALYYLARMLESGEDPLFIARRMVVFASEDVGLADVAALPLAVAAKEAVHFVGLPEARINLGHAVAYLARAPKSRAAYRALDLAIAEVRESGSRPVPIHLRNAPTKLMKELGYGESADETANTPEGLNRAKFLEED